MYAKSFCPYSFFIFFILGNGFRLSQSADLTHSPNSDNYHFEKWTSLEFASEHVHQIKQTSGLIHSPYGSFDPLMDEYPTIGELNTGDYGYSDRPVFVIQSDTSDISGISSSVEEARVRNTGLHAR